MRLMRLPTQLPPRDWRATSPHRGRFYHIGTAHYYLSIPRRGRTGNHHHGVVSFRVGRCGWCFIHLPGPR